jgi:hypothetical protein
MGSGLGNTAAPALTLRNCHGRPKSRGCKLNVTALLIILFSHQGYWLSGQDQTVTVRWVAREPMPPADLVWELGLGSVKLDGGSVAMNADPGATVAIKAPNVRVRTKLRWAYQLVQRDGKKLLESGEVAVADFPADLTEDWSKRIQNNAHDDNEIKDLVVWDDPDGLPKILKAAKVPFTRVSDLTKVLKRPDMILVGPNQIDGSPFSQGPLAGLAAAGTSVAVFAQKIPDRLAGYALGRRELPADIRFKPEHPLFERLTSDDLHSWVAGTSGALWAVQLPPDEPALELAWWAAEAPGDGPRPIDALIVTKTIGPGRIVLCQMPLGPWDQDPRSQILLGNLLSYLATRPQPTPPPSERCVERPAIPQKKPTIIIPEGANP